MAKTEYNRIKAALADGNKTNKEMAILLRVSEATVSSWCTNNAQPSIERLFEIAKFLDIDVRLLLKSNK